jgi:Glutamine amidotransferase domain
VSVCVNGEIYNHKDLRAKILEAKPGKKFATESDCEVRCSQTTCSSGYLLWLGGKPSERMPHSPLLLLVVQHSQLALLLSLLPHSAPPTTLNPDTFRPVLPQTPKHCMPIHSPR